MLHVRRQRLDREMQPAQWERRNGPAVHAQTVIPVSALWEELIELQTHKMKIVKSGELFLWAAG